ncbi:hypothetical protein GF324_06965 [bacterium]|nr:hypothetical protein [bacterium]
MLRTVQRTVQYSMLLVGFGLFAAGCGVGSGGGGGTVDPSGDGPGVVWSLTYGETQPDFAGDVLALSDGALFVGDTYSDADQYRYGTWITVNSAGEGRDIRYFGASTLKPVRVTGGWGGGYVVLGYLFTSGSDITQPILTELGPNGADLGSYVAINLTDARPYDMITYDDGYIEVGATRQGPFSGQNAYIRKLSATFSEEWLVYHGESNDDAAYSVTSTPEGEYMVAGYTTSYAADERDIILWRLDEEGQYIDNYLITQAGNQEALRILRNPSDGTYLLLGYTDEGANGDDVLLLKVDGGGQVLWRARFGGVQDERGMDLVLAGTTIVIVGYTNSFGNGDFDAYYIGVSSDGMELWTGWDGGASEDIAVAVAYEPDRGFYVAGNTQSYGLGGSDVWMTRLNTLDSGDSTLMIEGVQSLNQPVQLR